MPMMGKRNQTKAEVESNVIEIIARRANVDRKQITRDRRLVDIGIRSAEVQAIIMEMLTRYLHPSVDSLDVVEIAMNIEEQAISTVGDVIDYVHELSIHAPKSD